MFLPKRRDRGRRYSAFDDWHRDYCPSSFDSIGYKAPVVCSPDGNHPWLGGHYCRPGIASVPIDFPTPWRGGVSCADMFLMREEWEGLNVPS